MGISCFPELLSPPELSDQWDFGCRWQMAFATTHTLTWTPDSWCFSRGDMLYVLLNTMVRTTQVRRLNHSISSPLSNQLIPPATFLYISMVVVKRSRQWPSSVPAGTCNSVRVFILYFKIKVHSYYCVLLKIPCWQAKFWYRQWKAWTIPRKTS